MKPLTRTAVAAIAGAITLPLAAQGAAAAISEDQPRMSGMMNHTNMMDTEMMDMDMDMKGMGMGMHAAMADSNMKKMREGVGDTGMSDGVSEHCGVK